MAILSLVCVVGRAEGQAPKRPATKAQTPPPSTGKATTPPPSTAKAATPAPAADANPDGLPPDYEPPPPIPDIMTLNEPLLNQQDLDDWKKIRIKYGTAMRNGSTSDADKQIIIQGLKFRLYIMTMPDQLRELHDRRLELVAQDLQQAGKIMKPADVKPFRQFVMEQIVKLTAPLLKNNFYVRLQAATLLGELDLMVDDVTKNLKHETYTPACELLLKVIDDPEQPTPVKIAAARSIIRLVRYGVTPVELRHRLATSLLAEFAKPDTHYWYQMRLAEALSTIDVSFDLQNRKPFVVNGLLAALRDPKRDFRARAKAARALGRVPLDVQVDISALMRDLMKFAEELATAAQQNPSAPQWRQCFFDLYLAFKPIDGEDKDATKKSPAGLLNNSQAATAAQKPYSLIVPFLNSMIADKGINLKDLQALQDWLKENAPAAQAGAGPAAVKPPTTVPAQPVAEQK